VGLQGRSTEAFLADELDTFYAHIEADNTEPSRKTVAAPYDLVLSHSEADVRKTLKIVNTHKALAQMASLAMSSECVLTRRWVYSDFFHLRL
jgi:hypothetical protein